MLVSLLFPLFIKRTRTLEEPSDNLNQSGVWPAVSQMRTCPNNISAEPFFNTGVHCCHAAKEDDDSAFYWDTSAIEQ